MAPRLWYKSLTLSTKGLHYAHFNCPSNYSTSSRIPRLGNFCGSWCTSQDPVAWIQITLLLRLHVDGLGMPSRFNAIYGRHTLEHTILLTLSGHSAKHWATSAAGSNPLSQSVLSSSIVEYLCFSQALLGNLIRCCF